MPEGPSLIIVKERLQPFAGRKVTGAGGYSKMDKAWIREKKLLEIQTWGKHLLLRFSNGTVRIHLMLFGSLLINEKKKVNASLSLSFNEDEVNFYVVQVKKITEMLSDIYDWRTDIMSPKYNRAHVKKLLAEHPDAAIGDLLMDQEVFTGVGNIIRNEILFRARLHPLSLVKAIPLKVLSNLLKETLIYSRKFLKDRKAGNFGYDWDVYQKKTCPRDHVPLKKGFLGKVKRKTYYCSKCQIRYR